VIVWAPWLAAGLVIAMLSIACIFAGRELVKAKADLEQARLRVDHQSTIMARVVEQIDRVQASLTPDNDQEKHWKGFRGPLFQEPRVPRTDVEKRDKSLYQQLEFARQELVGE